MNQKTATVTAAVYTNRTFQTQYGEFHVHSITFDNGDTGDYNAKTPTQDKFVVGQQASYEITPNANPAYAAKIKPFNPNQGNYSGGGKKDNTATQRSIERQQALKLAIEYSQVMGSKPDTAGTLATAELFYKWISQPEEEPKTVATPQPGQPSEVHKGPDNLPW